jgi:cytochrome c biogenesis protein CcmG, thiol:disulfide interchange protein DsbE
MNILSFDAAESRSDTLKLKAMQAVTARPSLSLARSSQILLLVLTLAFLGVISYNLRDTTVHEGDRAPEFSVHTDQGQVITPAHFGGKVLVLNFWATWCQPCVTETPSLSAFQRAFQDKGVVVLGVSIDKNAAKYNHFRQRFRLAFQTYRDPQSTISSDYGTFQIPETYIIKDGRIVRKYIADQNWTSDEITQYIQSLL